MLASLVTLSIRFRVAVLALLVVVLAAGGVAARFLPVDAVPDVSTVQVSVLTDCPGLSPVEVERTVTFPMEAALNGLPRLTELRSVSRNGLSSVTVIFKDGTDVWFARQMVLERVRGVEPSLPKTAGRPELSPVSGGLGEIYQFVIRSDQHSPMQLRTILDWEVVPKLRSVSGVIEVNTMGGDLKEYQVVVDRGRLHAHKMTLASVADALAKSNVKNAIETEVPGTFVSVSQPIEDKTNELISGSRADVQIAIFGQDLPELKRISEEVGATVRGVRGAGDVRVERVLGAPTLVIRPDRVRLARYGVAAEDALAVIQAARVGIPVGSIYEGQKRFDLRLLVPPRTASPDALGELFVEAGGGNAVPLAEVARVEEDEGPTQVRREGLKRTVRVEVNLRGRDLVSWVDEARSKVAKQVKLPTGYSIEWGGQFENFERAKKRLAMVVPMSIAIIFGMLLWMFRSARYATAVFAVVPFALIGGILGLVGRGLSFSIPAAVGFIALAGVSVLNGVVMAADVQKRLHEGAALDDALREGAAHTMGAVLATGAVAALGFFPMAIATGAGAEVQRPLATVVISGIAFSTLLTLFLLPGVLHVLLRGHEEEEREPLTIPPQPGKLGSNRSSFPPPKV